MAADVELLPLPEMVEVDKHLPTGVRIYAYDANTLKDYARANVAHAVAPLQAEIEALRAEVAAWRELSDHVRVGACAAIWPDRYVDERIRDVAAALKRAERLAEEVERLRADRDSWEQQASDRVADWHAEHLRAERLAEALEDIRSRSSIDLATRSNPFELTARLGDIHQIADSALSNGGKA